MAAPVFLSYSWEDMAEVDDLDELLRFRGIPVWRDRRAMRWGVWVPVIRIPRFGALAVCGWVG